MDCTEKEHITARRLLFRGGSEWSGDWRTTHSRVVHGIAYAHIDNYPHVGETQFHGWLDRKSLDTSSFAAVHTMAPRTHFDLLGYNALEIEIAWADDRTYAIVMEDERAFGFEGQFRGATTAEREELKAKTQTDSGGEASDEPENKNTVEEESVKRIIRFDRLVPTRRDVGADTIRTLGERNVRGFGIIIRNTNDEQSGTFSLSIKAIYAIRLDCDCPHKYGPDLASRVPREEDISRIKLPSPVVEVKNPRSNKRARLSAAIRSARKSADELAVRLRASKAQPPRPE